jgi:molybdate/tungstate transport system substrate-binding protein
MNKIPLLILHAGALQHPMERFAREFRSLFPEVEVRLESAGSRACARKLLGGYQADIIALADPLLFDELLLPHPVQKYYIFATDQIVITHQTGARGSADINPQNWTQILLRDEVSFVRSDENLDPCGYRTLMVWQLAEKHYGVPGLYQQLNSKCTAAYVYPKSLDLGAVLQGREADYAFQYLCTAKQYGLDYVTLPEKINLSNPRWAGLYGHATVEVEGKTPGSKTILIGEPIEFAAAVPLNAPHPKEANEFLQLTLSHTGQSILEDCGLVVY